MSGRDGNAKKIEMLFAHLKRIIGLRRLRLRGPTGAKDEFLLAATAQNLRKLSQTDRPGNARTPRGSLGTSHRKRPAMPVASQLRSFSTISVKSRLRPAAELRPLYPQKRTSYG